MGGVRWARLAAEQGHAGAQYSVGLKYANGRGVPQEYVQAHKWVSLAASCATENEQGGYTDVRKSVAPEMTSKQISEAQRIAREWRPKTWEELKESAR